MGWFVILGDIDIYPLDSPLTEANGGILAYFYTRLEVRLVKIRHLFQGASSPMYPDFGASATCKIKVLPFN